MYILTGLCMVKGHNNQHKTVNADCEPPRNPCPMCGGVKTCDLYWHEPYPFTNKEMQEIFDGESKDGPINTFPSGVLGAWHPKLVVFVDDPKFNMSDFEKLMKRRVEFHMANTHLTQRVVLVSKSKETMQLKLDMGKFKPTVDKWRWFDPSFALLGGVTFRDINFDWVLTR